MLYGEPELWHALMRKLTEVTVRYLTAQIEAGAQVVQLFDSWLGLLDAKTYRQHVLPYTSEIFARVKTFAPTIHFSTATGHLLPDIVTSGCDLVSVDWRIPIEKASTTAGPTLGLQGNLDPAILMTNPETIRHAAADLLEAMRNRPGYIFNLGHGLMPTTPVESLHVLTEFVQGAQR